MSLCHWPDNAISLIMHKKLLLLLQIIMINEIKVIE